MENKYENNPLSHVPEDDLRNDPNALLEESRQLYEKDDPYSEVHKKVYDDQCSLYEDYEYDFPHEKWEIHYVNKISQMPLSDVFAEYKKLSEQITTSPSIDKEKRWLTHELILRYSVSDSTYRIKRVMEEGGQSVSESQSESEGYRDHRSSKRFLEVEFEGEIVLLPISNRPLGRDLPEMYPESDRNTKRKEIAGRVIESLKRGESATEVFRWYMTNHEDIELLEATRLQNYFNQGIIARAIEDASTTQLDSTMDFDETQPEALNMFRTLKTQQDFEEYFGNLDLAEKDRLSHIIGDYLGKLSTREVRFPESDEVLLRLQQVSSLEMVNNALRKRVEKEAAFWGKTQFDPIDDLAKMSLQKRVEKGGSLDQTIALAKTVGGLPVDLTKGNIIPTPQEGRGLIDNVYLYSHSEIQQLGGPGLYFGIFGGFRNWNSLAAATYKESTRAVVKDLPIGWTKELNSRAERLIQAERIDFPESAYTPPSEVNGGHIIDGKQVSLTLFDITNFKFGGLLEMPIEYLQPVISSTIVATFQKYIPGARYLTANVTVEYAEYSYPFISLPKDADPIVVRELMQHFQIANITYHENL